MNILYIVPYPPSLIRVRPYNFIHELTKRNHDVTVATIWTYEYEHQEVIELSNIASQVERSYLPRWRSYWNCVLAIPTRTPLQAVYSWQPSLVDRFGGAITRNDDFNKQFDIVHVEHLRGSRYGLRIKEMNPAMPVVWDSVDCISLLFKLASTRSKRRTSRWVTSFELRRNQRYEGWLLSKFDHTIVTSQIDKNAMLELSKLSGDHTPTVSVLPNGVNLEFFKPDEKIVRESDTIVVSGKMSYHANVSMVLNLVNNIMPIIWASKPSVKLWIVGKDPSQEIRSFGKNPQITVTGTVDDIRPYLQQATVAVAPITYGVGIQNKVLEAMACGTPVVSTPQAISSLGVIQGEDVLIAERPDDFAKKVLQIIDNPTFSAQVGSAGLRYVENHHRWSVVAKKLEEIYHDAITKTNQMSDMV